MGIRREAPRLGEDGSVTERGRRRRGWEMEGHRRATTSSLELADERCSNNKILEPQAQPYAQAHPDGLTRVLQLVTSTAVPWNRTHLLVRMKKSVGEKRIWVFQLATQGGGRRQTGQCGRHNINLDGVPKSVTERVPKSVTEEGSLAAIAHGGLRAARPASHLAVGELKRDALCRLDAMAKHKQDEMACRAAAAGADGNIGEDRGHLPPHERLSSTPCREASPPSEPTPIAPMVVLCLRAAAAPPLQTSRQRPPPPIGSNFGAGP
ncbi:hypothetical protein [Oryza sativa Japonica Group]|uniref:Uncharacterized protein n=1 Tax=Oryza sativa subsp. japonica TaxID=39947 RepID=Q5JKA0_ORYSJ|nr:hypothetical protein [Oryza sativa Japonica Group]BAD88107.1 hypothetical protein [Oryza sativa Japonica Group]